MPTQPSDATDWQPPVALEEDDPQRYRQGVERILDYLGEMHYTYTGSFHHGETIHKIVYWYLMKAESEGIVPQNEEGFVEGRYFPLDKVTSMAKYNDERKIIDAAIKKIRGK